MSAETIARWSSIPMAREEGDIRGNKRPRNEDANGMSTDDTEDNISIVSRSPSPPPQKDEAMDVDQYDGYYGYVREEITVETKIKSTNKGFAMLSKLGWSEGQPLGVTGEGRVDPIPFYVKNDLTGVGKMSQDVEMIETTVSQRRELDSERQRRETRDERAAREEQVARRAALQAEVSETLRAFYCAVCEKQFQTVAQYDEHTNSYAHHHKIRFRDMQAAQRAQQNTQDAINARKEKERKREEKELRKIAKAAGVKMPSKPAGPAALAPVPATAHTENEPSEGRSVASLTLTADPPARSGWAALGSAASAPATAIPAAPPASSSQSIFRSGGWSSLEDSAQTPLRTTAPTSSHGFTPVAAQPQQQQPEQQQPEQQQPEQQQPEQQQSASEEGFQPVQPNTGFRPVPSSNDGFKPVQSGHSGDAPRPVEQRSSGFQPVAEQRGGFQPAATLQQPPSSAQLTSNPASAPSLAPTLAPLGDDALPKKRSKKEKAVAQEKSRSGWQAFQRGGKR